MVGDLGSGLGGLLNGTLLLAEDLDAALLSGDNTDSLSSHPYVNSMIAVSS